MNESASCGRPIPFFMGSVRDIMNRVHDAGDASNDGLQRCIRCNYILSGAAPYWPAGFVTVTAKHQHRGADERFDLCDAPKEPK